MRGRRVEAGEAARYAAGQRPALPIRKSLMSNLFSPIELRGLKLANRIMVAPRRIQPVVATRALSCSKELVE